MNRKTTFTRLLCLVLGLGSLALVTACGSGGGDGSGRESETPAAQLGAALPVEGDFIAIMQEAISVPESSRAGNVVVTRHGTADGASSVQYRFVAGSASLDSDYRGTTGTLNWADGESGDRTIEFVIESDAVAEGEESFQIQLFGATGDHELGINDSVTVSITDSSCNATVPTSMTGNTALSAPCYLLSGSATFGPSGQLSISPGTTIIAAAGSGITLVGTSTLNSEGTSFLPVSIKGADSSAGVWRGFNLQSTSALHRIKYTEIHDAENAVHLHSGALALFKDNVMRNISGAGVVLPISQADSIAEQNSFINTVGGIELTGTKIDAGQSVTLPAQSTHYVLSNGIIIEGTVALSAGVDLRMGADVPVLVLGNGAISALGTIDNPVNISGLEPRQGFWNGIQYVSAINTDNRFEHVTIAHGGGDPARAGNIIVDGLDTNITMQNCALNDSAGYGIVYDSSSFQVELSDISFRGNRSGEQSM